MGPVFRAVAIATLANLGAGLCFADGAGGADLTAQSVPEFRRAVEAIEAGRYDEAVRLLRPYVLQYSRDADGHNWLGFAYRKTGQMKLAFESYERALGVDPRHRGAHEYIGEAYLIVGEPAKAERHLKTLADLCRSSCEEYKDLAKAVAAYKADPGSLSRLR